MRNPFDSAIATERGWAHPDTGELLVSIRGLANPIPFYKPNSGPVLSWAPPVVQEEKPKKRSEKEEVVAVEVTPVETPTEPVLAPAIANLEPIVDEVPVVKETKQAKKEKNSLAIAVETDDSVTFKFTLSGIEGSPQKAQWSFEDGKPLNRKKGFDETVERVFNTPGTHEVRVVLTYSDRSDETSVSVTVKE